MSVNTAALRDDYSPGVEPSGAEQRCSNRLAFRQLQRIAPYVDGPLPPAEAFVDVSFCDIAQGGFSYLADSLPESSSLIVAMQVHNEVIHVKARIVHRRPSGEQFLIGCQFEDRVCES